MSAQFKDDHDRLRVMVNDYVVIISKDVPPDITEVMKGRTDFTRLFHAHLASESRALEALRTGSRNSPADRLIAEHARKVVEVFLRHSGLIQRWPTKRIIEEWQAYCLEVRAHRDLYFAFLAWEESVIHPLLAGSNEIRRAS